MSRDRRIDGVARDAIAATAYSPRRTDGPDVV
jgi:hypothetical protein